MGVYSNNTPSSFSLKCYCYLFLFFGDENRFVLRNFHVKPLKNSRIVREKEESLLYHPVRMLFLSRLFILSPMKFGIFLIIKR